MPEGSFYVAQKGRSILEKGGLSFITKAYAVNNKPQGMVKLLPSRIALFDKYGGSIPSGWVRWMLKQFHYPFTLVYPQDLDKGNLNAKYDVILFINEAMPPLGKKTVNAKKSIQPVAQSIPEEFRGWLGSITLEKSIPQIKIFLEKGGQVVTVGSSANLADHLELPIENALQEVNLMEKKETLKVRSIIFRVVF